MPKVKVVVRKRKSRSYSFGAGNISSFKIVLAILILSIVAGKLVLVISESIAPRQTSVTQDIKSQMIEKFKEQHGDNWKEAAKAKFGGMDDTTKQALLNKYKDYVK